MNGIKEGMPVHCEHYLNRINVNLDKNRCILMNISTESENAYKYLQYSLNGQIFDHILQARDGAVRFSLKTQSPLDLNTKYNRPQI